MSKFSGMISGVRYTYSEQKMITCYDKAGLNWSSETSMACTSCTSTTVPLQGRIGTLTLIAKQVIAYLVKRGAFATGSATRSQDTGVQTALERCVHACDRNGGTLCRDQAKVLLQQGTAATSDPRIIATGTSAGYSSCSSGALLQQNPLRSRAATRMLLATLTSGAQALAGALLAKNCPDARASHGCVHGTLAIFRVPCRLADRPELPSGQQSVDISLS
jgi:hypothetical protein